MKRISALLATVLLVAIVHLYAQEVPATFTYKVGEFEVVLLSEGQQSTKPSVLIGATPEQIAKTMPDGTYISAVNAFLIKTPIANVLVDAGFGRKLFDNLESVGVSAEDINYVLITHMHGDHISGLLKDGKIAFPNATLCIPTPEVAYWTSEEIMNSMPENRRGGFKNAMNVIDLYTKHAKFENLEPHNIDETPSKYIRINGTTETLSGIFAIKAFGHTPGHTMFLVESQGEQLLIWGDVTHILPMQMPYPEISVTYDVDPKMAAESRKKVLEFVTANKIPIAGMHVAYPAIGNVEAYGKGYRFSPATE